MRAPDRRQGTSHDDGPVDCSGHPRRTRSVGNVDQIDPCTTRLRSVVKDPSRVDAAALRAVGAYGVMISGHVVQVVVGPHADNVASDLADLM